MGRNTAKIVTSLRELSRKQIDVISGTVVAGSVDAASGTMSLQPSDGGDVLQGVMLSAIIENVKGIIQYPKDGSQVVAGAVDGDGEWVLLRASELEKVSVTLNNVVCTLDGAQVDLQNGSVVFNIGTSVFKMNTASESLYQLLSDLLTGLTALTVGTSTGPSSVPLNAATFSTLITRLNNLLSA
jgi:hypothetical protein